MFLKAIPADRGHFIVTESEVWYQPPFTLSAAATKRWFLEDVKVLEVHLRRWLTPDLWHLATVDPTEIEILSCTVRKQRVTFKRAVTPPVERVKVRPPPKPIERAPSFEVDLANLILQLPLESIPVFGGGLGVRTLELSEQIPADLRLTEKACRIIRKTYPNWPKEST